MTAVFCHNAKDRTGASWHDQLAPFKALEFAVSDAAKGIALGLARVAQQRRSDDDPTPLAQGLDLFHTVREARTVLGGAWRVAEAAWKKAEAIDAKMARSKRAGVDARGVAQTSAAAWRRAESALERAQTQEDAWARVEPAFELFDPEGRLNDRERAQAQIAAALPELGGEAWARARNFLGDHRSLAFLDRMHERLAKAEPRADWREAMAWRWWGHHRRPSPASCPGSELVRSVAWGRRLSKEEQESYERVSAVLGDTVRASSAVECMNSVLRMHQSRHKVMTQAMLDLKRLYWNCHATKQGRRKGASPYQHLGLDLPSFDSWELLQTDPKRLTQELSGKEDST